MTGLQNRWAVLALMFVVGLNMPMQFQALLAAAPFLIAEDAMDYGEIGLLTGLFMAPGVFLSAASGVIAAKLGDRWTLALGVGLMSVAGFALTLTDSFLAQAACRLLGGAGGVAITVFLPKIATDWFSGKELATAQSAAASSFGLGLGIALAVIPALAETDGWRFALQANAAFGLVSVVVMLLLYRDHAYGRPRDAEQPAPARISREETVLASLGGVGRGLFGAGYVAFMSFAPPVLILGGLSASEAGLLTSVAAVLSIASVPLGGYLTDLSGRPNLFIAGGAVTSAAACFLLPYFAPALLWIVAFGVLRGGCTGGILAMPGEVLRPESRRAGFAVVSASYFVCMAAFPAIGGYILEATARPDAAMWFAGGLWLAILAQLAIFRTLQARWVA